jgi:2-oxoglutaroyl-CoA hydrolase
MNPLEEYARSRAALLEDVEGIRVEKDTARKAGYLIFDRPPMNIITFKNRFQIRALLEEMDDDPEVRVIVIRGANGLYSSGGEIPGFLKVDRDGMSDLAFNVATPARCRKPVIVGIEKFAMGVSFELALACDFRIATEDSQLALPEINLGIIPGSGGTHRVAKIAGVARAKEMVMRGRRLSAQEAFDWGLVSEVVPSGGLDEALDRWVEDIATRPQVPISTMKWVLNGAEDMPLSAGMEFEGQAFEKLRPGPEFKHGVESFINKKKPDFSDM